jgi:hypothetical protein
MKHSKLKRTVIKRATFDKSQLNSPELQEELAEAGRRVAEMLDQTLMSALDRVATSTLTFDRMAMSILGFSDSDSLVWNDIEKAYDLINNIAPVPVAIWFIDRPDWYCKIKIKCEQTTTGIPLIDYRTADFDPEFEMIACKGDDLSKLRVEYDPLIIRPWFCREPGIWVQMSNDEHYRLFIDEDKGTLDCPKGE